MPKPVKAPARGRRTKTETQQEFAALQQEVETAKETADSRAEEAARLRDAEVRAATDGVTVETVINRISSLGLEVSRALGGISEKLAHEVEQLASLRESTELERKEIERLHKIDVAATSVSQLVEEYAREKDRLEAEIAARRAEWEEVARNTERERKEQEEALKRQRQREIDDYEYKKALERKKAQDKYDEDMRLLEKKNKERQEALDKDWKQREAALSEAEEELERLRKESSDFPVKLQKEAARAALEATRATEQRLEQQMVLLRKDAEAERKVAELQVKALEEMVARQSAQMAALQQQLEEAKKQVQEIAVRAIEGASGARALQHVNQIAMEQAKQRQQP